MDCKAAMAASVLPDRWRPPSASFGRSGMPRAPTPACGLAVGDGWMHEPKLDGYRLLRSNVGSRSIQVADILAEANEYPESHKSALQLGYRTAIAVHLVHGGQAIGGVNARPGEGCPFTGRTSEFG